MVAGPRVLTDGRPAPPPSVVPCPPVGHLRVGADRSAAAGVRTLLGHLAARRRGPREFLHPSSPRPLRRLRLRRPRRDRGVRVGRDRAAVGGPPSPHRRSLGAGRILAHRDRRSVPGGRFPWDEAWHRLVAEGLVSETFWSPPHVMAIAGGIVSTFGFFLAVVLERTRWNGARTALGLVGVALGAGLLLFSLQVLLGPMDFATSFNGQVLRDAIAYPTGVSLAAPAVLVLAVLAGRRPGLATVSAAIYTGLRSLMVVG